MGREVGMLRGGSRTFVLLALGVVVGVFLAACGEPAPEVEGPEDPGVEEGEVEEPAEPAEPGEAPEDPVTVGVVTSLTTALASSGVFVRNGFVLAIEEINEQGGVAGRPIEVVEGDTADSNTAAVNALQRLLEREPVAVAGPIFGTQVLAMSPIVEEAGVPMFYFAGTVEVSEHGNEWLFGFSANDRLSARAVLAFAADELGLQRIAVSYLNNEYGIGAATVIAEELEERDNAELVSSEAHELGDTDMSAQLRNHMRAEADGFISWGFPGDTATIMRQAHELGWDVVKLGTSAPVFPDTLELVTEEQIQGWYGAPIAHILGNDDPAVEEWKDRYAQRWGQDAGFLDALSYDAGRFLGEVLHEILTEKPDASVEEIRQELLAVIPGSTYQGIDGFVEYEFDETGRGAHGMHFVQFVEGKVPTRIGYVHASDLD